MEKGEFSGIEQEKPLLDSCWTYPRFYINKILTHVKFGLLRLAMLLSNVQYKILFFLSLILCANNSNILFSL